MNLSPCKIRKSGWHAVFDLHTAPELMRNLMYATMAFKGLIYANISVKCASMVIFLITVLTVHTYIFNCKLQCAV